MDKPNGKSQTRVTISCGCGFLARSLVEARVHVEAKGHVMTLHGQMGPVEKMSQVRVEVTSGKR